MDQTKLVYRAEQSIFDFAAADIATEDVQSFLREAYACFMWLHRRDPPRMHLGLLTEHSRLPANEADGEVAGICTSSGIYIHPSYLSRWVLLHELAHWITDEEAESHGPVFRSVYVDLVTAMLGQNAGHELRTSFDKHGVALASADQVMDSHDTQELAWLKAKFGEDEALPGWLDDDSDLEH